MRIVDIINDGANLLGMVDVCEKLSSVHPGQEEILLEDRDIKRLFNTTKFAIQELCTHYIPVVVCEDIKTENASYPISKLPNYIKLIKVTSGDEVVSHKISKRVIMLPKDGVYTVEYTAYPQISSLFESADYLMDISPDVVVYGLCSYYALATGQFQEFERFHEEYIKKAENIRELKIFDLPRRRWQWVWKKD